MAKQRLAHPVPGGVAGNSKVVTATNQIPRAASILTKHQRNGARKVDSLLRQKTAVDHKVDPSHVRGFITS